MRRETLLQFLTSPYSIGPWLALGFALGFALQVTTAGVWVLLVALVAAVALPWLASRFRGKIPQSAEALPIPGLLLGWLVGFMVRGLAI